MGAFDLEIGDFNFDLIDDNQYQDYTSAKIVITDIYQSQQNNLIHFVG